MNNINYETYFQDNQNKYYDSKVIISILEDILGKPIHETKKHIEENKIIVTKEQIKEYLEKKFIEENPELKKRLESPKRKKSSNPTLWTEQDIKATSQNFVDNLSAIRYYFEPYTLEYFNRYTTIVRNKIELLLEIIEKIGAKDITSIQDVLSDLDVLLDENGNILKSDIIRLITPTVYNINDLNEKIAKANDLSTYLTFKMSKDSLYRNGCSESEIYPPESIQVKNICYDYVQGNVCLSDNQRKQIEEEDIKNMNYFLKRMQLND